MLIIKNCNESDKGIYFLLAACTYTKEDVKSNELNLDIVKGKKLIILQFELFGFIIVSIKEIFELYI